MQCKFCLNVPSVTSSPREDRSRGQDKTKRILHAKYIEIASRKMMKSADRFPSLPLASPDSIPSLPWNPNVESRQVIGRIGRAWTSRIKRAQVCDGNVNMRRPRGNNSSIIRRSENASARPTRISREKIADKPRAHVTHLI